MPDLEATGALPPDDTSRNLQAELEAEFADHLALVARDEMLRGRTPDEAEAKANERFGDLTHIERQCRWVHQGDAVMLRTVMIGGLVVLALALGYSTWTSRQGQADLRQQLTEVTAKLEAMAETQPPTTTGTISGIAFLGDKSKPAAGVEIQLLKAPPREIGQSREPTPDWVVERTLTTDASGRYRFEALAPGTYSVVSNLCERDAMKWRWGQVQSRPSPIAPGSEIDMPLDVELRSGTVRLALSRPLPGPFKAGDHELRLSVQGVITQRQGIPVDSAASLDDFHDGQIRGYPARRSPAGPEAGISQRFHYVPDQGFRVGSLRSSFRQGRGGRNTGVIQPDFNAVLGNGDQSDPTEFVSIFSNPSFHVPAEEPRGLNEEKRWIEGEYTIEAMLFVTDSTGEAVSLIEDRVMGGRSSGREFKPATAPQSFSVANGKTTDLRIVVPEEIDQWGTDLADFLNEQMSDTNFERNYSRAGLNSVQSGRLRGDVADKFADLLNHPFEIEVTGPHSPE